MEDQEHEWNPPDPSRREDEGSMIPIWIMLGGIAIFFAMLIIAILTEGARR